MNSNASPSSRCAFTSSADKRSTSHTPNTAWVRQNTVVIVHPLRRGTSEIGNYDVIALRLIERIERLNETSAA